MSPSYHTLSKALDISKKIPVTSRGGLKPKMHKCNVQLKIADIHKDLKV